MLNGISRVRDGDSSYNIFSFLQEAWTRCYCCVVDPDEKNERCCSLLVANPDSTDFFGAGKVHEVNAMTPHQYIAHAIRRCMRAVWVLSIVLFGLLGFCAMMWPEDIIFNHIADDIAIERMSEGRLHMAEAERQQEELNKREQEANEQWIYSVLNGVLNQKDTTQKQRLLIEKLFEQATQEIDVHHAEVTTVKSPVILFGGFNVFYVFLCIYDLMNVVALQRSVACRHGYWFLCGIFSYVMATVGRGPGMHSANIVVTMILLNIAGTAVWAYIYVKIGDYHQRGKYEDKDEEENERGEGE